MSRFKVEDVIIHTTPYKVLKIADSGGMLIESKSGDTSFAYGDDQFILASDIFNINKVVSDNLKLKAALSSLIFHFHDYGIKEESFALLFEVIKAEQVLKEVYNQGEKNE